MLAALEETLVESEPVDYFMEEAIGRGRLEIRQTYLYERKNNLPEGWQSISRIAYVRRIRLTKTAEHTSDSFYVSDLQTDDAEYMAAGIRSHWGIENKLHYTKDVTMREDRECTANKKAASNLALFRNFAFNILKTKDRSIKYACEIFANYMVRDIYTMLLRT